MATLPLSQRRRKQPKPRHLNKDFSGLVPVDQFDAKGDVRRAMDAFGDDRCYCETCLLKFDDPESFLDHLKSCPGSAHDLRQQSLNSRDSDGGEEAEEGETSENDGYADPEFRLYDFRRSSETVNRYAHLGTDVLDGDEDDDDDDEDDDDETAVHDSPDDNDDDRMPGKTQSNGQKRRRSSSPSEENEMTSRRLTEVTSQAEDCSSRLSGSDRAVPSKMLDMHQLYLVLIQLQQQQLLQLRMLDVIQKKLAENIMLTTSDLVSGFPELVVPPFGVVRSLSGSQALGPNGLSQSSDPSGEPNAPRKHQDSSSSATGVPWSDHRKPHSSTAFSRSQSEADNETKQTAATEERCEYGATAERQATVIMTGDGMNSLLQDEKSLSRNHPLQQNSSKASLLDSSLGSEFSEAFKKGRMSMPTISSGHLLSSDQLTNETDGRPNDNVIFRHRCRLCLKVLGSDSALQIHMRSHTGERPYKCNICGNRFTTKGNLKVHFSRHQEQYPNIRMNSDPVPEHLDQLGHPPPPGLPPPPLAPPPTTILSGHIPQSFYSPGPFLPATIAVFNKGGMMVSSASLIPSSTVTSASAAGAVGGTVPLSIGDCPGKVKSGNLFIQSHSALQSGAAYSETVPQIISKTPTEARSLPTGTQSKVISPGDIPNSSGSIFPSPLTALSSMSSSLPSLKSPLNLSFPGPLAMAGSGMPLLPPFRVEPTPALLAFTRNSIPSSKEDDHLEQFMEIHLPESGKMDELVKEGGGKVSDPNECAVCHRVLSCRSALQMHYRTHTGERPYRCKLCSRTFTTKGNLKTHMSVHRGKSAVPPTAVLRCPVCSRDFANGLVLQQHMRTHGPEPHRHLPMPGTPMMMPVLNHLFPFPVNFPYFGPGFAPFRHHISPFGLKDQVPNDGKRHAAVEASSNQTSNDEESVKKKRRISEGSDGEGRMGQQHNLEDRIEEEEGDEDEERDISLDIDVDLSAYASRDHDNYASPEERPDTNDGTDNNNSAEESTLDCDMTIKRLGKENGQRSDSYVRSASTGGRERQEEGGYQGQSPILNSSLASYATCPSLTDQYSSPLIALEERVNAIVYPGRCFKQALQLEPSSDTSNVGLFGRPLKSEIGDKTEEESRFSLRMEHQSPSIIGPFGATADVGHSALYGKPGVIQSPAGGFHSVGQMEMIPGGKPHVVCQVCGKTFACRSALEIHLRSHTKEKPFQCQICGRAFSTKGNLKQHVLMTHSVSSDQDMLRTRENTPSSSDGSQPPMSSPPMGSVGLGLSGLMLQQIGESSVVVNAGPVLANKLEHSLDLSATPSDKKSLMRYLCNVCKKAFSSTSALEIHMRTHTGDRPFVCILCGKAFTTKGNLKVHMSTHAWNKCPSRRGRRMLMDAMPPATTTSFKADDAVSVFGRCFVRPSAAEAGHYPMLGFPDYFLPKPSGSDAAAVNGYRDDATAVPGSQQTMHVDASGYETALPPPRPQSSSAMWTTEQKEKIKEEGDEEKKEAEEEGNNNGNRSVGQNIREQEDTVALGETEPAAVRTAPSLARTGYMNIPAPAAGTLSQSSLLWPTDLSQGHQQLALNCR